MKRKTVFSRLFAVVVCTLFSLTLISCSNLFESESFDASNETGTAYICVKSAGTATSSRTVFPTADSSKLTNLVLKGTKQSGSTPTGTQIELASAATLEALSSQKIEIESGSWTFKLTATMNGVAFSGTTTAVAKAGKTINLRFQLTPDSSIDKGGFSIKLMVEGDADEVEGLIYKANTTSEVYYTPDGNEADNNATAIQTLIIQQDTQNKKYVSFSTAAISETTGFTEGDYRVRITFKKNSLGLNEYETSVQIKKGYVSEAVAYVNLAETYSVTLHLNGGSLTSNLEDISYHLRKDSSLLPASTYVKKSGFAFAGWYDNSELTGNSVTSVPAGTTGNKNYWAKWEESTIPTEIDIYVSATNASDSEGDGSQEHPYATIQRAVQYIIAAENSSKDWVIGVDGMLSGAQTLERQFNGETYIELVAHSVTVSGLTGSSTDGINAGWGGEEDSVTGTRDSALLIDTTVPVSVMNLTICGGDTKEGGGLKAGEVVQSDVTLKNVCITGNCAVKSGGGIFISKASSVTMLSGEIKSNRTKYISGLSGTNNGNGGGVYMDQNDATFTMKNGSISENYAFGYGGGVYIGNYGVYGNGRFVMSGGSISANDCDYSFSKGIYVIGGSTKSPSAYFEMSGAAVIASDNDVFLGAGSMGNGAVITISGTLTGETPVATISGEDGDPEIDPRYMNDQVLVATGNGSVAQSYKKFAVKPYNNVTPYYIDSNGYLTDTQPQSIDLYIRDGASGTGTSAESPFGSIFDATDYIRNHGNSATTVTIKISGNLSGAQQLIALNNSNAKEIFIEGTNGTDANGVPKDALTGGSGVEKTLSIVMTSPDYMSHVPVTISNLKITGASQHGIYVGNGNGDYWNEVYLDSGVLITGNGSGTGDYDGGGVYVDDNAAVVVRNGCTISNNTAGRNGGGIYALGYLDLEGGTITGNTAQKGKGIYVPLPPSGNTNDNGVRMYANASVANNNDVYLCTGEVIILGESLNSEAPVATITPEEYDSYQVVGISPWGNNSSINLEEEVVKFAVAQPEGSAVTWSINTNGMLSDGSTTVSFYVAQNGSSSAAGSRGDPFDSLSNALSYIASNDYTGYDVIVKVDGVLPVADHEAQHTVYISSFSGNSLTIEGANGLENGIPQDSISGDLQIYFDNYVLSEITFRNICLTGSSSGNYIGGGDGEIGYYRTNVIFDSGVLITGNSAEYAGQGAAFTIKEYSSVTMKDGCEISGNYNTGYGSDGVYIDSYGTFNMEGGTIKDNKESGNTSGTGVEVCGTFNISGGAVVASNNVIELYSQYTNVTIADDLTADGIVATISPATSGETGMYVTPAVLLSEAKSGLISAYHNKFAVMPKSGMNWAVDDKGNLVPASSGGGTVTFYVAPGGTGNGSSEISAFGSIDDVIVQMTDENTDYIVNVCGDMSGGDEWDIEGMTGAKTITIQGNGDTNVGNKLPGVYTCSKAPVTFMNIQIGAMYIDAVQYDEDDYYHANVFLDSGTLIKGNTGIDEIHGVGLYGVVHLYDKGAVTLTMKSGAEISNNTYVNSGLMQYGACGGVYIGQYSEFIMEGGTISGNAVYDVSNCSDGKFIISGDAQAGVVYCKSYQYPASWSAPILIGGPITSSNAATIVPGFYRSDWKAIELAKDDNDNEITTTSITAEYSKFSVVPDNSTNWYVGNDGNLTQTQP